MKGERPHPAVTNPIPLPRASLSFFSEAARGTRLQTALQVLQVLLTRISPIYLQLSQ